MGTIWVPLYFPLMGVVWVGYCFRPGNGPIQRKHDSVAVGTKMGPIRGRGNNPLTESAQLVYTHSMPPITDILKDAIRNCGISNKKLEALSGVNRNSIARFMRGSTGLSLEQAEMLIEFFGIKLTKKGNK